MFPTRRLEPSRSAPVILLVVIGSSSKNSEKKFGTQVLFNIDNGIYIFHILYLLIQKDIRLYLFIKECRLFVWLLRYKHFQCEKIFIFIYNFK